MNTDPNNTELPEEQTPYTPPPQEKKSYHWMRALTVIMALGLTAGYFFPSLNVLQTTLLGADTQEQTLELQSATPSIFSSNTISQVGRTTNFTAAEIQELVGLPAHQVYLGKIADIAPTAMLEGKLRTLILSEGLNTLFIVDQQTGLISHAIPVTEAISVAATENIICLGLQSDISCAYFDPGNSQRIIHGQVSQTGTLQNPIFNPITAATTGGTVPYLFITPNGDLLAANQVGAYPIIQYIPANGEIAGNSISNNPRSTLASYRDGTSIVPSANGQVWFHNGILYYIDFYTSLLACPFDTSMNACTSDTVTLFTGHPQHLTVAEGALYLLESNGDIWKMNPDITNPQPTEITALYNIPFQPQAIYSLSLQQQKPILLFTKQEQAMGVPIAGNQITSSSQTQIMSLGTNNFYTASVPTTLEELPGDQIQALLGIPPQARGAEGFIAYVVHEDIIYGLEGNGELVHIAGIITEAIPDPPITFGNPDTTEMEGIQELLIGNWETETGLFIIKPWGIQFYNPSSDSIELVVGDPEGGENSFTPDQIQSMYGTSESAENMKFGSLMYAGINKEFLIVYDFINNVFWGIHLENKSVSPILGSGERCDTSSGCLVANAELNPAEAKLGIVTSAAITQEGILYTEVNSPHIYWMDAEDPNNPKVMIDLEDWSLNSQVLSGPFGTPLIFASKSSSIFVLTEDEAQSPHQVQKYISIEAGTSSTETITLEEDFLEIIPQLSLSSHTTTFFHVNGWVLMALLSPQGNLLAFPLYEDATTSNPPQLPPSTFNIDIEPITAPIHPSEEVTFNLQIPSPLPFGVPPINIWEITWEVDGTSQPPTNQTSFSQTFNEIRTYNIRAEISVGGQSLTTPTITVTVSPATTTYEIITSDNLQAGQPITFGVKNTDGNSLTGNYSWNFGDGTTSPDEAPTHTYQNPESYTVTVTVTVTDASGNTETFTKILSLTLNIPQSINTTMLAQLPESQTDITVIIDSNNPSIATASLTSTSEPPNLPPTTVGWYMGLVSRPAEADLQLRPESTDPTITLSNLTPGTTYNLVAMFQENDQMMHASTTVEVPLPPPQFTYTITAPETASVGQQVHVFVTVLNAAGTLTDPSTQNLLLYFEGETTGTSVGVFPNTYTYNQEGSATIQLKNMSSDSIEAARTITITPEAPAGIPDSNTQIPLSICQSLPPAGDTPACPEDLTNAAQLSFACLCELVVEANAPPENTEPPPNTQPITPPFSSNQAPEVLIAVEDRITAGVETTFSLIAEFSLEDLSFNISSVPSDIIWKFGDPPDEDSGESGGSSITHTYQDPGNYTVSATLPSSFAPGAQGGAESYTITETITVRVGAISIVPPLAATIIVAGDAGVRAEKTIPALAETTIPDLPLGITFASTTGTVSLEATLQPGTYTLNVHSATTPSQLVHILKVIIRPSAEDAVPGDTNFDGKTNVLDLLEVLQSIYR